MTDPIFNVLFLCTGKSARSIMAESIFRSPGAGRFDAFSGSHPKGVVNPFALKTIKAFGCSTEGLRSKTGTSLQRPRRRNWIFCDDAAGEACPAWPGQPMTAHWGIEYPAAVEGADIEKERAFAQAFRYLRNRITVFIALAIKSLDGLSLTARLCEIGGMEGATRSPMTMRDARRG